jgi:hypothetical protein
MPYVVVVARCRTFLLLMQSVLLALQPSADTLSLLTWLGLPGVYTVSAITLPSLSPERGEFHLATAPVDVRLGDLVRLKKPHPCGENRWEVTRIGMEIGLKCSGCGRAVRLPRAEFERRFRGFSDRAG